MKTDPKLPVHCMFPLSCEGIEEPVACMSSFPLTLSLFPEVWPSYPRWSALSNEHSERFDTARKRGKVDSFTVRVTMAKRA